MNIGDIAMLVVLIGLAVSQLWLYGKIDLLTEDIIKLEVLTDALFEAQED